MSQENVELIKRGFERWLATGELRAPAGLVWDVSKLGWPDQQMYSGAEGARQFNAEWADTWDDLKFEVEDYVDAGERVVVILNQRARSKTTGIPVEMRLAQVWTLQDGHGIRMQMYSSVGEALEAVGASARDSHAESA
jgi:ketosteroid isomerase-like protein